MNPFPNPINSIDDLILVRSVDFVQVLFHGTVTPRLMLLVNEPGTHRLFCQQHARPEMPLAVYKPWSDNDTRNHNAVNAMYKRLK